jgi:hypothetical protein
MSRRRPANRDAQHIRLYHSMIKSPAWSALSGDAVKILLDLWHYHDGRNNGQISVGGQFDCNCLSRVGKGWS